MFILCTFAATFRKINVAKTTVSVIKSASRYVAIGIYMRMRIYSGCSHVTLHAVCFCLGWQVHAKEAESPFGNHHFAYLLQCIRYE